MKFSDKVEKLKIRRVPYDPVLESYSFSDALNRSNESYSKLNESSSIKYAIGVMQPIDPSYTKNTFNEGDRIKKHLEDKLPLKGITPEFRYQGSVTSDTHILAHSDIDLLTIHNKFITIEPPRKATSPYKGNPIDDLVELRKESISILRKSFPSVTVDDSGSKSIALCGGSLKRKVDVVPSNWYDTNKYYETGEECYRGVMILDNETKTRPKNQPFLHNKKIDDRDALFCNNLRKSIRLLKSIKYDSDKTIKVSSYDIAALAYCMPDRLLNVPHWYELMLVDNCVSHLQEVLGNVDYRNTLWVPDGSRKIFGTPGATVEGVRGLCSELTDLKKQIEADLGPSYRSINRSAIQY